MKPIKMQYITRYPKTVSLIDGIKQKIHVDKKSGVEELHLVVKENVEKIQKMFAQEGATRVKFEHKQPFQIGDGLSLKLTKPLFKKVLSYNEEDTPSPSIRTIVSKFEKI